MAMLLLLCLNVVIILTSVDWLLWIPESRFMMLVR